MKRILVVLLILCGSCSALDLGVFGPTYLIKELDAFDWIVNQRLPELERNGEIDKMNAKLQKQSQIRIENPRGITLPQATSMRLKKVSLIYTLPRDVSDAKGRILFKKGTSVNPADVLPESNTTLVFIDGNIDSQVNFALKQLKKNNFTKVVLVAGRPLELMRNLGASIYFDQYQRLTDRFGIRALPAKVHRQKSELIIEEVVI